jgi:hypothetical protein
VGSAPLSGVRWAHVTVFISSMRSPGLRPFGALRDVQRSREIPISSAAV